MSRPLTLRRLQALGWLELFTLAISALVVLLPRRGTLDFDLPPDLATYLIRVLLLFGLMNGVYVVMAAAGWMIWVARGRPYLGPDEGDPADPASAPPGSPQQPGREEPPIGSSERPPRAGADDSA